MRSNMIVNSANLNSVTGYRLDTYHHKLKPASGIPRSSPRLPTAVAASKDNSESASAIATSLEMSEANKIVDGMSFGQLCNEFECISSPAVEVTARHLARDILEMREGNRALGTFAVLVKYKDPLRTFTGRQKYTRSSWMKNALDNPSVAVHEMMMQSTSTLNVKWMLRGRPKFPASVFGGDVVLYVNDKFTLNQISGQVIEHIQEWDLSQSSPIAHAYFWASRLGYAVAESAKDAAESLRGVSKVVEPGKDDENNAYYSDPSGDPTKFFQIDENPQRDLYQIGLFISLVYLVVQFLRSTL